MNENAIDQLLDSLCPDYSGWSASVPPESGRFFGHSVELQIQTRKLVLEDLYSPDGIAPPRPDNGVLASARRVLASLPKVLQVAEEKFAAYEDDRFEISQIDEPTIWLSSVSADEGPDRWAFVIGRLDWPDYGVHVEFDGLDCVGCWGGD